MSSSWAFVLEPRSAAETRLIMRRPRPLRAALAWTLLGPLIGLGDFVNAS